MYFTFPTNSTPFFARISRSNYFSQAVSVWIALMFLWSSENTSHVLYCLLLRQGFPLSKKRVKMSEFIVLRCVILHNMSKFFSKHGVHPKKTCSSNQSMEKHGKGKPGQVIIIDEAVPNFTFPFFSFPLFLFNKKSGSYTIMYLTARQEETDLNFII